MTRRDLAAAALGLTAGACAILAVQHAVYFWLLRIHRKGWTA
jgi:hypothetical protein